MNALEKKEIRLLLPGFIAVLLLEAALPWFMADPDFALGFMPVIFFFGVIILAVDSFGREFHAGTFQLLLSQPIARGQFWRTKIVILSATMILIFGAYFASCALRLHLAISNNQSLWHSNPEIIQEDFWDSMLASGIVMLVASTGGLWTALLFRQVATAFWITFLTPAGLLMAIIFFTPESISGNTQTAILEIAATIYSIAGFWLARKLFYQAQDAAWTGGVINFSRWRYFESGGESSAARWRRPIRALFRKEFQLHSIALIGGGALLGMHIVVFFLRPFYEHAHKYSTMAAISDFFWVLWLVMPLLIGCMAVAEERKLGVVDEQFCLPVSRRLQFLIKFLPTMFFGILIGGVMPLLLETIAKHLGDGNEIFTPATHPGNGFFGDTLLWFEICVVALSAGFALAAFFASTIARNFLQALSITIVTVVGSSLFVEFVAWVNRTQPALFGILPWHSILPILIALLIMPITLIWLAYLNFNYFQESKRLWRRNVLGISGALIFVIVSSALIYNRAWEIFEPAEPPHGAAKLSLSNPPKINAKGGITILMPNGRAWLDYAGINFSGRFKDMVWLMLNPLPRNEGPAQFISGSNWLQVATDAGRTIGLKSDGTLWITPFTWNTFIWPHMPTPPRFQLELTNATGEADWQAMDKRGYYSGPIFLLKTNHTLWEWSAMLAPYQTADKSPPPSLPIRAGTNSDWAEIFLIENLLKKIDGTVWRIDWEGKTNKIVFERETNLDDINFKTLSRGDENGQDMAYVGTDKRLMVFNWNWAGTNQQSKHIFLPCGDETNWVAVSVCWHKMIALKSNGTLWQWHWDSPKFITDTIQMKPTRLGIHNDWVAIGDSVFGTISLATDGSVWLWFQSEYFYDETLMKNPKQPEFLGNVFGNEK